MQSHQIDLEDIHHDYLLLTQELRCTDDCKVRMLTALLAQYPGSWRVVGITREALEVFAQHDYRKKSGMGIQRAHLVDRFETYLEILAKPLTDFDQWRTFYLERDKCVLATSSQNNAKQLEGIIEFDEPELFHASGYGWRHRVKHEAVFLRELHSCVLT